MKKITLTEALIELKNIDKKIHKKLDVLKVIDIMIKGRGEVTYLTDEKEIEDKLNSSYQSVNDIIKHREKIKSALLKANNSIIIKINDKEMTIAEAIEFKNSTLNYKIKLLEKLKLQHSQILDREKYIKNIIDERYQDIVSTMVSGKDSKTKEDDLKVLKTTIENEFNLKVITSKDLLNEIEKLEKEIEEFTQNIDVQLSIANSTNHIEI